MEHPKRSLVKALTWRIIGIVITVIVIYFYTKDIKESLVMGIAANVVKIFFYYVHERIWNRIKFGRIKPPEYQI